MAKGGIMHTTQSFEVIRYSILLYYITPTKCLWLLLYNFKAIQIYFDLDMKVFNLKKTI